MNLTIHNTLDITSWKQKGSELATAIEQAVKDTQSTLVQPYPDELKLTQAQYNLLKPGLLNQGHYNNQEFYLYQTKYNVMELKIT